MVKLINRKVQASTLIEVLIALVIIMAIFVISIQVFNNVLYSGVSLKKLQAQNQLNILSEEIKQGGTIPSAPVAIDSIVYEYQVFPNDVGLSQLEIKASMWGKTLGTTKCLFKNRETRALSY